MNALRGLKQGQVEVVLEVNRSDCKIAQALAGNYCSIERLSIGPNTTLHKVRYVDDGEDIKARLTLKHFKYRSAGLGSLWVEADSCDACAFFSESFSGVLGSRTLCDNKIQYRVLLPSLKELKILESKMKKAGLEYKTLGIIPYVHQELTERQREILRIALEYGYFEEDTRMSLTDLAKILEMAPSSLSEILRRSTKKAITFYFDHRP